MYFWYKRNSCYSTDPHSLLNTVFNLASRLKGVVDLYAAEELRIFTATLLLHRVTSKVSSELASNQYNVDQFEDDVDKQDYLKCFKSIALWRPVDGTVTYEKAFKMILDSLDDYKTSTPMMSVDLDSAILNIGLDFDTRVWKKYKNG